MFRAKKFVYHLPYLCVSSFLALFIFLTNSVNVHAQGNSYTLPYNVVDYSDNNNIFTEDVINGITTTIYNNVVTNYCAIDLDSYFFYPTDVTYNINTDTYSVSITICSGGSFDDTSSISSIYANSCVYRQTSDYTCCTHTFDIVSGVYSYGGFSRKRSGSTYYVFGSHSSDSFVSGETYQLYYPVFANSYFYDINDNPVIIVVSDWVPESDAFDTFIDALDITSTISNGIDNSLSDLQNQKGFFDNLVSNLKNMFNSLNGWLNNGFTFLSNNIKNFFGPLLRNIQNYINEFKGSFEDFKDKWDHFFEVLEFCYRLGVVNGEFNLGEFLSALFVPSSNDIDNAFTGHSIHTLYSGTVTASKTYYNFFTTVFSGDYVYIFSLPNFTFGGKQFQGLEVNFSWFLQYKSYCDLIISAFLIIAYIRFLLTFINNFFYGSGFIDHDLNTIGGERGVDYTIPY